MSFQRYEEDYAEVASEVRQAIRKSRQTTITSEDAEDAVETAERLLQELSDLKQSMEMGAREVPSADRAGCERRITEYQTDIERMTADLASAKQQATRRYGRTDLLSGAGDRYSQDASDQALLAHSGRTLQHSVNQLHATMGQGAATLDELRDQRERLEHSREKLKAAESNVVLSNKVMRSMERRIMTNNMIRYATIAILLIGIAALLWHIIFG